MSDLARVEDAPEQQVLARMEGARQQLAAARTVGDAKQVVDATAAVCEWLRRQATVGLEIVNHANELKIEAEGRIGQFLLRPGAVKERGRPADKTYSPDTFTPPTHKDLGISRVAAQKYREVASVTPETIRELSQKATKAGRELTREAVIKEARRVRPVDPPASPSADARTAIFPPGFPLAFQNTIVIGDARKLAAQIPDSSVMLCLADPVWERVEDYEWLARECERVLVPGGSLILQVGTLMRFDCEVAMRKSGLDWVTLIAEVYPFCFCPLRNLRVQVGFKPYLWFSRGPRLDQHGRNLIFPNYKGRNSGYLMDRVRAKGRRADEVAKARHQWGDPEDFATGILQRLCGPGDVVWDPFTGSGTVPVVAKRLGLPFVASEINPGSGEKAWTRVDGVERDPSYVQRTLWDEEDVVLP